MGKLYEQIDDKMKTWLQEQPVFFIATSPLASEGHINLSPKGLDTLRVVDEHTLVFSDFGGSGIETISHLRENQRIVVMVCAFSGPPKIIRLHGKGSVVFPGDNEFSSLIKSFTHFAVGIRALIKIDVSRISDSCGFGIPLMDFKQQRETSVRYLEQKGVPAVRDYLQKINAISIDGLPGLTVEEAQSYAVPDLPD